MASQGPDLSIFCTVKFLNGFLCFTVYLIGDKKELGIDNEGEVAQMNSPVFSYLFLVKIGYAIIGPNLTSPMNVDLIPVPTTCGSRTDLEAHANSLAVMFRNRRGIKIYILYRYGYRISITNVVTVPYAKDITV